MTSKITTNVVMIMYINAITSFLKARGSIGGDDQDDQKGAMTGEEEQQKIQTYEEAFKRIKEATGVSETSVRT